MPTQDVEFDQLLTAIETDYVEPEDYDEEEIRRWCQNIAEDNRGRFEIGYEMDLHGYGNRVLTQITYISLTEGDDVWFRTDYQVADIVPAPPVNSPAEDEEDEDEGVLPALPYGYGPGHRRTGADGQLSAPPGHQRTRAFVPEPHPSQLAAQSQTVAQGIGAPPGHAPGTLLDAITVPAWWDVYLQYAQTNLMAENAQFVADLGGYMNAPTWDNFDRMVNLYIAVGSSREINISHENRQALIQVSQTTTLARQQQQPGPGATVFGAAYAEVYGMLTEDYERFKKLHP